MANENPNEPANPAGDRGTKGHPVFKIQIDKHIFETRNPLPTGRELLELAGKNPPEQFALYLKPKGEQPKRIALADKVDLREPGVERFVTLPLDQTEGLEMRKQFALPSEDLDWLESQRLPFELVSEGGVLRVIVHDFPVPSGYNVPLVSANVRIEPGYPDSQIDMVYFYPHLARSDGKQIGALATDNFDGKTWQRWSRHRTPANPWRPGIDNLSTHFALVHDWLSRELLKR
jgi:hypothetical protein